MRIAYRASSGSRLRLPVEIDAVDDGEGVAELHAEEEPIFQRRPQLTLAVGERLSESDHARAGANVADKRAVFELSNSARETACSR